MKKILFFVLMCCALVSCDYEVDGARLKTIRVTVNASDWQYTQQDASDQFNNNYFYAAIPMPEITENVFDYGEVKAYAVYDRWNIETACKQQLPFVLHKEEVNNLGEWYYYTETVDFTYGIEWAMVNFTRSDFLYEDSVAIAPPAMDFDIVITYPQD
jgi:hypothetical protein